jgi:2,4-dienoyl-CoA reductase-like NADH-dependent reductase (Old Yellow Enzyme family)
VAVSLEGYADDGRSQETSGILMRYSSASEVCRAICGERWISTALCWTFWYRTAEAAQLPSVSSSFYCTGYSTSRDVKLPVVGASRMDSPAVAERALAEGKADMIGMAKTLIADPHFPNKAKAGKVEDIRQCIAFTQSCAGHVDVGLAIGCTYNSVVGREKE